MGFVDKGDIVWAIYFMIFFLQQKKMQSLKVVEFMFFVDIIKLYHH